jgi:hypothetical protein
MVAVNQQMMPEPLNEAKFTQYMQLKCHKEPYDIALETSKGGVKLVAQQQTHTHSLNNYLPLAHAPRVNYSIHENVLQLL